MRRPSRNHADYRLLFEERMMIRFLDLLGDEFEGYSGGAMWEDTLASVSHWTAFEKMALVADHAGEVRL